MRYGRQRNIYAATTPGTKTRSRDRKGLGLVYAAHRTGAAERSWSGRMWQPQPQKKRPKTSVPSSMHGEEYDPCVEIAVPQGVHRLRGLRPATRSGPRWRSGQCSARSEGGQRGAPRHASGSRVDLRAFASATPPRTGKIGKSTSTRTAGRPATLIGPPEEAFCEDTTKVGPLEGVAADDLARADRVDCLPERAGDRVLHGQPSNRRRRAELIPPGCRLLDPT